MSGNILQLNTLNQSMSRIGDQHVGLDGQGRITRGSTNWFGRAVNWIKSVLGLGGEARANRAIMNHVVSTIRETEGMGDRFADIARGRLHRAMDRGRPITGRKISAVISDLVRLQAEEQTARTAFIKDAARTLCDTLCAPGDSPLMDVLQDKMIYYGLAGRFEDVRPADVIKLREKVQDSLEGASLGKDQIPTEADAKPVMDEACRMFAMNMVKESIARSVSDLASCAGPDSPMMAAFKAYSEQRGMEVEIEPEHLNKLAEKFGAKLTSVCLNNSGNLHPPAPEEATQNLKKVVESFLDGLAMVDTRADLLPAQQAMVKKILISSPHLFTPQMVTALCDTVEASLDFVTVLTDKSATVHQMDHALASYHAALNSALYQQVSEGNLLLREGIGGAPEADTVRQAAAFAGISLAGITGETARKTFYDLADLASPLAALRFKLDGQDAMEQSVLMKKMTVLRFLGEIGERSGVNHQTIEHVMSNRGVGSVAVEYLRTTLGEGVHGQGGITIGDGFNGEGARTYLGKSLNEDMAVIDTMELASGAPASLEEKASHFSKGFLKDFFRSGITVDGERIPASGTQDYGKMERALDLLIGKFTGIEEAGRVTRPLFQSVGAGIMLSLMSDPVSAEHMKNVSLSRGDTLNDALTFSITSRKGGSYDVQARLGLQKDTFWDAQRGTEEDGLGLCARLDMTVACADSPGPGVEVTGFDFVFGRVV